MTKPLRRTIEELPEEAWVPIPYFCDGAAVAETTYTPFTKRGRTYRLIVRRVRPTPGSQLALFTEFSYHAFVTDREGDTLHLEADHRRHAECENTIRDLKYGVGLNHLPSGRFGANAAWLGLNVIAHNLTRWVSRVGLSETLVATDTVRRRHLGVPGRVVHSGRRLHLRLPTNWPWAEQSWRRWLACGRSLVPPSPERSSAPSRDIHRLFSAPRIGPPSADGASTGQRCSSRPLGQARALNLRSK